MADRKKRELFFYTMKKCISLYLFMADGVCEIGGGGDIRRYNTRRGRIANNAFSYGGNTRIFRWHLTKDQILFSRLCSIPYLIFIGLSIVDILFAIDLLYERACYLYDWWYSSELTYWLGMILAFLHLRCLATSQRQSWEMAMDP